MRGILIRIIMRLESDVDGFSRSVYGPILKARFEDRTFLLALRGTYGFFYSEYLTSYRRGTFRFLDIGANLGLYSLIAGSNPRCDHVYSFEPSPDTFTYLKANLEKNAVNATPYPFAISSLTEGLFLSDDPNHSGSNYILAPGFEEGTAVEAVGPDFLSSLALPEGDDILIKIDVEGHEVHVLEALSSCGLLERAGSVWVEIDEKTRDAAAMLLLKAGLKSIHENGCSGRWDQLYERPGVI